MKVKRETAWKVQHDYACVCVYYEIDNRTIEIVTYNSDHLN